MISAVIHTYNEEKNIKRCLSSLDWVDEIVVIDMGSTDKTCDVVNIYNVKLYNHPYTGYVEPARNFGISKARGEWILIIDADEEIPITLSRYLRNVSKSKDSDYYRIARRNIIFDKWVKHTGWWPDYQIRFFKKTAVSWNEKIHSIPVTRGKGSDITASLEMSIIHYNYQTVEQFITRLNRYTSISAKELFLSNEHFHYFQLFDKPAKEFINRYFIWEGYKDGIIGLALSFLQSVSELVIYIKLWELEGFTEHKINLEDINTSLQKEYRLKKYWLIDEMLKTPHNILHMIDLLLKRKV